MECNKINNRNIYAVNFGKTISVEEFKHVNSLIISSFAKNNRKVELGGSNCIFQISNLENFRTPNDIDLAVEDISSKKDIKELFKQMAKTLSNNDYHPFDIEFQKVKKIS